MPAHLERDKGYVPNGIGDPVNKFKKIWDQGKQVELIVYCVMYSYFWRKLALYMEWS